MLLVAAFAIYVIVTKRLRITRSTTVTGTNARNFGITLLVLLIPMRAAIAVLLNAVLSGSARVWPMPQVLSVTIFAAIVIAMAYFFRDSPAISLDKNESNQHGTKAEASNEARV